MDEDVHRKIRRGKGGCRESCSRVLTSTRTCGPSLGNHEHVQIYTEEPQEDLLRPFPLGMDVRALAPVYRVHKKDFAKA